MENALLFTGLLLGAALTGGYFGACCAKSRQGEDLAKKLQALQDRIEFLETKVQDADERLCLCERYDGESAQRIWLSQKFMENAHRIHVALRERQDLQGHNMLTQATLDRELRSMRQTTDASVKLTGSVLAGRIDVLSARLDAVELACGIREKPKTMGGAR